MKSGSTDDLATFFIWFGEGQLTIPIFAAAAFVGSPSDPGSRPLDLIGQWGSRRWRSVRSGRIAQRR